MATLPTSLRNIKGSRCTNKIPLLQKSVHSGWMWKKGALNQLSNKRWFEIKGDQLYYFKSKGDTHVLGQISLAGNEVKKHNILADSNSGKYIFELVAGKERKDRPVYEKYDSLMFGTDTPYEIEEWIKAINRILYTPAGGGMFGRPLKETIKIDSVRGGGMVPIIVEKCVEYLKLKALNEEGIFRVPGLKDDVELLKTAFNKGDVVDFQLTIYKINIVASVMKQYIGDLPESVIPPEYYEDFIAIGVAFKDNQKDAVDKYNYLLKKIPMENFNLLKYLCRFLHLLQTHESTTKMSLSNLSLVFGPNILRPQNEDPALLLKSLSDVNAVTIALITYQEELFPVSDNEYYYQSMKEEQKIQKSSFSDINLELNTPEQDHNLSSSRDLIESPSEMFLDVKHIPLSNVDLRRSRSEGNLFAFIEGLEGTPACSGRDYYDWTTHLKKEIQEQRNHYQAQIKELENKLDAELKIREMIKLRLTDEHKARKAAEDRLETYRIGIEEYCKMFGHSDINIL